MERVLFNRDLLTSCILPRLSIFDVFSVFQTCKGIREAYARQYAVSKDTRSLSLHLFQQRTWNGLAQFYGKTNADRLMVMLNDGLIYLTGGFLLALMNAQDISACADADFVSVLNCPNVSELRVKKMSNEASAFIISMLSHSCKIPSNHMEYAFYDSGFAVDTYSVSGKNFQIIHVKNESIFGKDSNNSIVHNYCNHFDFKFCANYFAQNRLVCIYPWNVKNRTMMIDASHKCLLKVPHLNDYDAIALLNRFWERVEKYRTKGYHIDLSQVSSMVDVLPLRKEFWNNFWQDKI